MQLKEQIEHGVKFYGRRLGRSLRVHKTNLVKDLLPKLNFDIATCDVFDPKSLFPESIKEYVLEIGFGGGENLVYQASQNPEMGFIGLDPFMNGVASLLQHVDNQQIDNIRLSPMDARIFLEKLKNESLSKIFTLFLDPWPKQRHHKRRLVTSQFIDLCATKLKPEGEFYLATDHKGYEIWMRDAIANQQSLKLVEEFNTEFTRPSFIPITRYEEKALNQNRFAHYFRLIKN